MSEERSGDRKKLSERERERESERERERDYDFRDVAWFDIAVIMIMFTGAPGVGRNELKRRLKASNPMHFQEVVPCELLSLGCEKKFTQDTFFYM